MKIVVISDLHLDARTAGMARFSDISRSVEDAADRAMRIQADFFLCLGDVMDPDAGSTVFRCIQALIDVTRILQQCQIPTIWLAGNHDVIEDGTGSTTLDPLQGLGYVIQSPGAYCPSNGPTLLNLVAFPFTPLSHRYDPKKVVKDLANKIKPQLIIGHLNVKGAQPGDEDSMPRGREVWLPVPEITQAWPDAMILNGHIHKRQITESGVHIPGSLERLRFDEERNYPGWMEIEL